MLKRRRGRRSRSSTSAKAITAGGEARRTIALSPGSGAVRAVWNGEAYVIFSGTILSIVSSSGEVMSTHVVSDSTSAAALAPAGLGRVLAIWVSSDGMRAAFFDGTMGASQLLPIIDVSAEVSLASDGDGFLLAWRKENVQAQRLDRSAAPIGPPLAFNAPGSGSIRAVSEGDAYLLMWNSIAVRIRDGIAIASFDIDGEVSSAAPAPDGTIILTRLRTCSSIRSTFLRRGTVRASATKELSTELVPPSTPKIATTSAGHQIVWSEKLATDVRCSVQSRLLTAFVGRHGIGPAEQLSAAGSSAKVMSNPTDDPLWLVAATDGERSLIVWLDSAREIVSLEVGSEVRRHVSPWPANVRSFITAGIRGDAVVIIARADDGQQTSLMAIDPFRGTTAELPRPRPTNLFGRLQAADDGWTLYFAEGDARTQVSRVDVSRELAFGAVQPAFCLPAFPFAIGFAFNDGALSGAAYVAEMRVHFRPFPQRRRAL